MGNLPMTSFESFVSRFCPCFKIRNIYQETYIIPFYRLLIDNDVSDGIGLRQAMSDIINYMLLFPEII